jgi:nucleotide-binding universal stress UspA family protein
MNQTATASSSMHPVAPVPMARILVAVDFSKSSHEAVRYAAALARDYGSSLSLLHVEESGWMGPPLTPAEEQQLLARMAATAREELAEDRPLTPLIMRGKPFHQIVEAARESNADLVVVGTRGLTGLKHALLGSTAERVIQHAPCPVLVVRPVEAAESGAALPGSPLPRRILVPLDFSEMSRPVLQYARDLALKLGATLILLHVAEHNSTGYEFGTPDFAALAESVSSAARAEFKKVLEVGLPPELRTETAIRPGWPFGGDRPFVEISKAARELAADLIILGTHGRAGLEHALLGSTAERVAQHAPCPVLIVPRRLKPF